MIIDELCEIVSEYFQVFWLYALAKDVIRTRACRRSPTPQKQARALGLSS